MAARTYLFWLLIALISGAALAQTPQIKWAPDLATARQASAQFKVPVLIHFYGDACLPCRTLEKNVFSNQEVISVLNKFFICVSINGTRDRNAMAEFEVHSYPTDVFLSPSGEKLFQGVCPQDLREYLSTLERVAVMNRDYMAKAAASRPTTSANLAQQAMPPIGGTQSNPQVPTLPPPAVTANGNSTTPGFYTSTGAASSQPHLDNGATSSKFVQSGPLLAGQQPPSIRGAVQSLETQVGSYGGLTGALNTGALNSATNQIATQPVPSLQQISKSVKSNIESYAQVPSVDNNALQIPTLTDTPPALIGAASAMTAQATNITNKAHSKIAQGQNAANDIWTKSTEAAAVTTENPHFNPPALVEMAQNTANQAQQKVQHTMNQTLDRAASNASQAVAAMPQLTTDALNNAVPLLNSQYSGQINPQLNQQPQPRVTTVSQAVTLPKVENEPAPQIDGYCPVSLRGKQWRKGNSQYAVRHRGQVYWFTDQTSADAFVKSPDSFMPVLMGYDPMVLIKQGQMQAGSTQFGLFEDRIGPLFFSSAESKAEFLQDFNKNMQALDAILKHASNYR